MISIKNGPIARAFARRARLTGVFVTVAMAGLYTAACDVHGPSDPGDLFTIVVSPDQQVLAITGTQQFTATGTDYDGRTVPVTPVWSIAAGGGTISSTGLFTAGTAAGTFASSVTATSGSVSATATVTVTPGPLASIIVTPGPTSLAISTEQQFLAVGNDASGNVVEISPTWSVMTGGGEVSGTGLFTAGTVTGTFTNTIEASAGGFTGTATVTVTAGPLASIAVTPDPTTVGVSATRQFSATGEDAGGNAVEVSPVWSVEDGGGTIDAATGLFTAGDVEGTFDNTVMATSGAISGTATVTVTATPPPPPPPPGGGLVNLGAAALNGIMAGQAVTCVSGGVINADVAISPGNTVTGFGGACTITGVQHLADGVALQAQIDLTGAYNQLAGMPCAPANAIVANLGGTTKPAGVYCTASSIGVTGTLTLDGGGDPNATFVFQAGTSLITAGDIVLIGGAQAKNVYWQVGTSATLGTASQWKGNILALTSISLVDNANLLGRALARNGSVSLGTNNVISLP